MRAALPALATISLAALWTACAAIVGVGDVPNPLPDAAGDAQGVSDTNGDPTLQSAADDAARANGGSSAEGVVDGSAVEAGSLDTGVMDVVEPSADVEAVSVPCMDGLVTKANGNTSCDDCGGTQCCSELAICRQPDDGGIDQNGLNKCAGLVYCIAGYENVNGATPERDCFNQHSTAVEQANAEAVVQCLRTECAAACPNL